MQDKTSFVKSISFDFPTILEQSSYWGAQQTKPQLLVSIYKAQVVPDDGHAYNLPSQTEKTATTITIKEDDKGQKKFFLGLAEGEAFFFHFYNPQDKHLPIAVKILINGVNVLSTEKDSDVYQLVDGDADHTTGQNFMAIPSQVWLDGFRVQKEDRHEVRQFVAMKTDSDQGDDSQVIEIVAIPYRKPVPVYRSLSLGAGGLITQKIYQSKHPACDFDRSCAQSIKITPTLDPSCRAQPVTKDSTVFVVNDAHLAAAPTAANSVIGLTQYAHDLAVQDSKKPAVQPAHTVQLSSSGSAKPQMTAYQLYAKTHIWNEDISAWLKKFNSKQSLMFMEQIFEGSPSKNNFQWGLVNKRLPWLEVLCNKISLTEKTVLLQHVFSEKATEDQVDFFFDVLFKPEHAWLVWSFLQPEQQNKFLAILSSATMDLPAASLAVISKMESSLPKLETAMEVEGEAEADKVGNKGRKRLLAEEDDSVAVAPKKESKTMSSSVGYGSSNPGFFITLVSASAGQERNREKLESLIKEKYGVTLEMEVQKVFGDQSIFIKLPSDASDVDYEKVKAFFSSQGYPFYKDVISIGSVDCEKIIENLESQTAVATLTS